MVLKTTKILVSKGLEPSLNFGSSILRQSRCSVYIANDGFKAMEIFEKIKPDLLLIDQNMEGISGDQVCRSIKSIENWRGTPIVLVSCPSRKKRCQEALCDGVLTKPFTESELFKMMRRFMKLRHRAHERIALSVKTHVQWKEKSFTAFSKDISEGGIFIKTHEEIPVGERIELGLSFFDVPSKEACRITGRVVRAVPPTSKGYIIPGLGISFPEEELKQRRKIATYLSSKKHSSQPIASRQEEIKTAFLGKAK